MPDRLCTRCGRPLNEDHHDLRRYTKDDDEKSLIPAGKMVGSVVKAPILKRMDGGKLDVVGWKRTWGCRTRVVGTSPVSGKTISVQFAAPRMKQIDNRHVLATRVQRGGDLFNDE